MSCAVDQVATVVLYSNDSYVKSVAIEEPGYVTVLSVLWFQHAAACFFNVLIVMFNCQTVNKGTDQR